jgi:hypothetical protein
MITKLFEIRDRATLITVMATKLSQDTLLEKAFFDRSGYANGHIIVTRLTDCLSSNNPFDWAELTSNTRTMKEAHLFIDANFDSLSNGEVIDVEFILKEVDTPKTSELTSYVF